MAKAPKWAVAIAFILATIYYVTSCSHIKGINLTPTNKTNTNK